MYTSGWPKNQNKCWNRTGSPPPIGSKKVVLKFRSVRSIVMAAARTGKAKTRRTAVIATDQTKRGIRPEVIPFGRIFFAVVIKLIEARIEDTPAR